VYTIEKSEFMANINLSLLRFLGHLLTKIEPK